MVDLEEYLCYLAIERASEFEEKIVRHDPEYQKIQAELEDYYLEIRRLLPEPGPEDNVIDRLQVTVGVLEVLIERLVYRQSLKDGAIFIKLLGAG